MRLLAAPVSDKNYYLFCMYYRTYLLRAFHQEIP